MTLIFTLLNQGQTISLDTSFGMVWNAFLGRSTTKPDDIHAILANMLDYSAKESLSLAPEQRLKALLYDLKFFPLCLLFNDVPRLRSNNPNERWVPAYPGGPSIEQTMLLPIEPEGIVLEYLPGSLTFILKIERTRPRNICFDFD